MRLQLPALPYRQHELEPYIGARTVELHYRKHHAGYLEKLKEAIEGTRWADRTLEEMLADADAPDVFRNAAQTWNHTFYWNSMCPPGSRDAKPAKALQSALNESFGDTNGFLQAFRDAATGHFGSGWAWLVMGKDGQLEVTSTSDADNPVRYGQTPLITLDVWEHAYYLDYQNERARYVDAFIHELINWRFAERNLAACRSGQAPAVALSA